MRRGVDASGALLADPGRFGGVIGSFAARLRVAKGFEVAITAALGGAAEAVAVAGRRGGGILAILRDADAGSAALVVAEPLQAPPPHPAHSRRIQCPAAAKCPPPFQSLRLSNPSASSDPHHPIVSSDPSVSPTPGAPPVPGTAHPGTPSSCEHPMI